MISGFCEDVHQSGDAVSMANVACEEEPEEPISWLVVSSVLLWSVLGCVCDSVVVPVITISFECSSPVNAAIIFLITAVSLISTEHASLLCQRA